eukprot:1158400-Pelagomonas_calceolata.AAC.7
MRASKAHAPELWCFYQPNNPSFFCHYVTGSNESKSSAPGRASALTLQKPTTGYPVPYPPMCTISFRACNAAPPTISQA